MMLGIVYLQHRDRQQLLGLIHISNFLVLYAELLRTPACAAQ